MAMETEVEIQKMPDYIDQATTSASIYGWGGPFILFSSSSAPDKPASPGVLIQRRICHWNSDPFAGKTAMALMGIYPSETDAESAVRAAPGYGKPEVLVYAFYRGPENFIYPTIASAATTPRLVSVFKALVAQESIDADEAAKQVIEVFFIAGNLRGLVPKTVPEIAPKPGMRTRPTPPRPKPRPSSAQTAVATAPGGTVQGPQMLAYLREVMKKTPLLNRLRKAQSVGDAARLQEFKAILTEFESTTQVIVEKVPKGALQRGGLPNLSSITTRPGYYQIEEQVLADGNLLAQELTHELPAYFTNGKNGFQTPGGLLAHQYLEFLVKGAEETVVRMLSHVP